MENIGILRGRKKSARYNQVSARVSAIRRGSRKKIEGGFICRPPTVKLAQYNKDFMTF